MELTDAELVTRQIASRLLEERLKLGVKSEDFAKKAGVGKTSQFHYEKGTRLPDALYLRTLRMVEGVDIQYVLTGMRERQAEGITDKERQLLDDLNALPTKLREHVETTLLLAKLAHNDRKNYPLKAETPVEVAPQVGSLKTVRQKKSTTTGKGKKS